MSSNGAILRPMSPGILCTAPTSNCLFMEKDIDDVHKGLATVRHEIVCALSSKAIFKTDAGDVIPDIGICYYWCAFCRFKTDDKHKISEHVIGHRFKCRNCDFQAFSRVDVSRHAYKAHPEFREVKNEYKLCTLLSDFLLFEKRADRANLSSEPVDVDISGGDADDCSIVGVENFRSGGCYSTVRRRRSGRKPTDSAVVVLDGSSSSSGSSQPASRVSGKDSKKMLPSSEKTAENSPSMKTSPSSKTAEKSPTTKTSPSSEETIEKSPSTKTSPENPEAGPTKPDGDSQPNLDAIDTEATSVGPKSPMDTTSENVSNPAESQPSAKTTSTDHSQPVTESPAAASKPPQSAAKPKEVKAGLVWGCPRCEFLTTVWRFAQDHVKMYHRQKDEEITKHDITNKIVTAAKMKQILQEDKERATSGRVRILSSSEAAQDEAKQDSVAVKEEGEKEDVKPTSAELDGEEVEMETGPPSQEESHIQVPTDYLKCIHCQDTLGSPAQVREHQEAEHKRLLFGAELVGAVNWKNFMYICPKKHCAFSSAEYQEFKEHMDTCIEGLSEDPINQIEIDQVKAFMRNVGEILKAKGTVDAVQEAKPFSPVTEMVQDRTNSTMEVDSFEEEQNSSRRRRSKKRGLDSSSSDENGQETAPKRVLRTRTRPQHLSQYAESDAEAKSLDGSEESEEDFTDDNDEDFVPTPSKRKSTSPHGGMTHRWVDSGSGGRKRGRPWKSQINPSELSERVNPLPQNTSTPNPPCTDRDLGRSTSSPKEAAGTVSSPATGLSRPSSASSSTLGSTSTSSLDSKSSSRPGSALGSARTSPTSPVSVSNPTDQDSTPKARASTPQVQDVSPKTAKSSPAEKTSSPREVVTPTDGKEATTRTENDGYKCSMCRVTMNTEAKIRSHLLQIHEFHPFYAIDLNAMKKNSDRYVLFCHGPECQFSTCSRDAYMEHTSTCTPWLEGDLPANVTEDQKKSLGITIKFIETTMQQPPHLYRKGTPATSLGSDAKNQETEDLQPAKNLPFVCSTCHIEFKTEIGLKIHMGRLHR